MVADTPPGRPWRRSARPGGAPALSSAALDPTSPDSPPPDRPPASPPGPPPGEAPAAPPPLPRPRAAAFLLALLGLLPVGLVAQALQPGPALVWTQLFAFALPAAALAAGAGLSPARFLRLVAPPPRALGLGLLLAAAALVVGGALQALWTSLLPPDLLETFDVARLFERPAWERALMVGAATALAPLCEEVAFRGHLLSALALRRGPGAAIALSAVAFAALHLDPVRLPGLLFLGVLYGWMTWRAGSVYPAILAHAVNNAAATALALGPGEAAAEAAPEPAAALGALLAGAALLVPAALAYHRWLPPAPGPEAALAAGADPRGRLPRWVIRGAWLAIVSLVLIALAPRR